jgi:hypothetical protein
MHPLVMYRSSWQSQGDAGIQYPGIVLYWQLTHFNVSSLSMRVNLIVENRLLHNLVKSMSLNIQHYGNYKESLELHDQ